MTDAFSIEEFDESIRRFERERYVPERLRDIEAWVAKIRSDPSDIRNAPDIRPSKRGGTFVSDVTDLDKILEHVAAVRRYFRDGEIWLALGSLRGLESRVRSANNRVTQPLIETGVNQRAAAKKGGQERSISFAPIRASILREMMERIEKGHSVSNAARLVFEAGFGRSPGANRKLWDRHIK